MKIILTNHCAKFVRQSILTFSGLMLLALAPGAAAVQTLPFFEGFSGVNDTNGAGISSFGGTTWIFGDTGTASIKIGATGLKAPANLTPGAGLAVYNSGFSSPGRNLGMQFTPVNASSGDGTAVYLSLLVNFKPAECIAGLILQGLKKPHECSAFGTCCTPEHPFGATMVSSEGACAAYYRYRRHDAKEMAGAK